MDSLVSHLANWKPFTALVVGDFMLDQFHYGDAERLSADAPVPVLLVRRTEDRPGGAANVCLDLAAMGGRVRAFGVMGEDAEAGILRDSLTRQGVDASGLVADGSRPTTVKRSLIGLAQHRHPQKMFREDFESREPLSGEVRGRVMAAFVAALANADVVCIEDYDKGVCTSELCAEVIAAARRAGKPVFVDPAGREDYSRYRGCTAITPNRSEAERATGVPTCADATPEHNRTLAAALMQSLEAEAVVLTLDRHGALLLERGGEPVAVPTVAREVYDVTGAGDMFLAALAAGRANGMGWPDAVRLANAAAGLEVEIFGVQPIPIERIRHSVLEMSGRLRGKLRTLDELMVEVSLRRERGQKIVFTNGCFDVIHAGHVWLLDEAKRRGDFLIVATNTDETIRRAKGETRPVNTLEDRARVLGGLAAPDAVVAFEDDTPLDLIDRLRPDVLVKGDEYPEERVVGASLVRSYGGEVVRVPMMPGASTSAVLRRIGAGHAGGTAEEAPRGGVQSPAAALMPSRIDDLPRHPGPAG